MKSSTQPGRYVGVLNDFDSQGRQILGILKPNGEVNFVPSAYGRNNFNKFLNDQINAGNLLYSKGTGSAPTIGAGQPVPIDTITDLPQNVNISPKQLYELANNLSEMTTWGKPGTDLQNNILERLYGSFSGRLKNISPELASAQQAYANLMNNVKQAGGFKTQGEINPRTIAQNLKNYGNSSQTLNGTAEAFRNLENSMPADYERILPQVEYLNALRNRQAQLQGEAGQSVFNDFSRYQNAPLTTQNVLDTTVPKQVNAYKKLLEQEILQNETLKPIMNPANEKNPRLLLNKPDEATENAINYLQEQSGVEFMPQLERIRARDAFEQWTPGAGGGFGTPGGYGNLVRQGVSALSTAGGALGGGVFGAGTGYLIPQLLFSPKIGGQAYVRAAGLGSKLGLDKIYNNLGQPIPQWLMPLIYGSYKGLKRGE